jgi:hypothetical protein
MQESRSQLTGFLAYVCAFQKVALNEIRACIYFMWYNAYQQMPNLVFDRQG